MNRVVVPFRSTSRSLALLRSTESLELDPGLLQIVVDDNGVVHTRGLRVSNLVLGLLQTGQNRLLAVRRTTAQTLLQDLDRRRLQEEEASVEVGLLHLLNALEIKQVSDCDLLCPTKRSPSIPPPEKTIHIKHIPNSPPSQYPKYKSSPSPSHP